MHKSALVNTEKFFKKYCEKDIENKKILDVGSYNVNGCARPIFEKGKYVGVDMVAGPNVDVVANCNKMPFSKNEFDIVISISCFEHDNMFWSTFLEILRVVKNGGFVYINAPSNGPYHKHPTDNWRFYPDSWKALEKWGKLNGFDIELVESYISEPIDGEPWRDSIGIFKKKELKKVALISSFCDSKEKLDVLEKNIKIVKSNGLDVIVISPFHLDKKIVDLCDYFFVTKDNPVLQWPERAMYAWKIITNQDKTFKITTTYADYGFAGLYQVKQLSEIALSLNYDQFFHLIYDLKINENVINGFHSNSTNLVYPSKREQTIWKVGLHYMIFDKTNLKKFISEITKEKYLSLKGSDAFVWLHSNQELLQYEIAETPVEDEIYYYSNHDFFNFSPIDKLKFFIEKNDETLAPIKIVFYDNEDNQEIEILIGEEKFTKSVKNLDSLNLNFNKFNMKDVSIIFQNQEYDITDIISKIKHNTLHEL